MHFAAFSIVGCDLKPSIEMLSSLSAAEASAGVTLQHVDSSSVFPSNATALHPIYIPRPRGGEGGYLG